MSVTLRSNAGEGQDLVWDQGPTIANKVRSLLMEDQVTACSLQLATTGSGAAMGQVGLLVMRRRKIIKVTVQTKPERAGMQTRWGRMHWVKAKSPNVP